MDPSEVLPDSANVDLSKNQPPSYVLAVSVRNAHKSYQKGCPILNNLSMSVPTGCIYSLLGSSGCGKSTLLSSCIGLGKLDKGEILMFGYKPGTKESGVPGPRIGFMPQELALYNELTIMEAFSFYGRVFGMNKEQITEAVDFMIELLDLPKPNRKIEGLSGGQKRRVSLAIAMIHGPELLILDEPTVGVDPLLRECIWKHLVKLVKTQGTTVIITTHYIQEAMESNLIGIMRHGRLLEEDSPKVLLEVYRMNSLEEIVLAISRLDAEKEKESIIGDDELCDVMGDKNAIIVRYMKAVKDGEKEDVFVVKEELSKPHTLGEDPVKVQNVSTFITKTTALLIKNFLVLSRNVGFLLFIFFLPAFQMILISLAIGADPKDIPIGVVNGENCHFESKSWRSLQQKSCPLTKFGENGSLSCFILAMLPRENFVFSQVPSLEDALLEVQGGHTYGYFNFPKNYTLNVECKIGGGDGHCGAYETQVKPGSIVTLTQDMTSKAVSANLKRIFLEGYLDSMEILKDVCKRNIVANLLSTISTDLPFEFGDPVYGKDDMSFNEFLAPGLLLALLFFFPLCSSAVTYIAEKKSGTLDRAIVAGIGSMELMAGYFVIQVGTMLVQAGTSFLILIYVFEMTIYGNFGLALLLTVLVGVSGMVMGFLVGIICKDEFEAVMLAMGTFFPNLMLAGVCWPVEAMVKALRVVSYFLPCTLACESMRSVVNRGWSFGHKNVWPGFASTFGWIVVYCIFTVLAHKKKHNI